MAVAANQGSARLDLIASALIARSNGVYDDEFVRDLVIRTAAEFSDAPVRDYLDVLVAKEATDELRRLQALRTIGSAA